MHAAIPGPRASVAEDDLPDLYVVNDRRALSRQSESFRAVRTQLTILLLATGTAMLSEPLQSHVPAAIAAFFYATAVFVGLHTARRKARTQWHAHRAAAEAVKSLAWQYMVCGGPFHDKVPDPDALFAERVETQLSQLRRLGWEDPRDSYGADDLEQITPAMRALRAKPFAVRRDVYLRDRVVDQLTWYRNRAGQAHHAASHWSSRTAVLTLLALVSAVLRATGRLGHLDPTGLLSAAAAATVAWQELRRHRPLTYAHGLVVQDLETLRIVMATSVARDGWAEAVAEAERLCSPQHTDWLVRFGA
jgi:SMODS and SLOG-associating 2TM effector domain 3/SMODS and SLOG-associating 2TM effector domain 1